MPDIETLKVKMDESGMTMVNIAKKSGILRETLYNRLNGRGEFTASEIISLSDVLQLTKKERDEIFLNSNGN
jgi:predicted transcriptional regulator